MKERNRVFGARLALLVIAFFAVIAVFTMVNPPAITTVYAASLEDNIGGNATETTAPSNDSDNNGGNSSGEMLNGIQSQTISPEDKGVSDWLKNQKSMDPKHLEKASETMNPLVNLLGYVAGGIVVLTVAGVVVITALDLMYIAIPPIRNILYKGGAAAGAGGMMGGYGGMGGMHGRFGMMGGGAQGAQQTRQWVSDEAVACAALLGGGAQAQGAMGGGMGMMGGYGGMGGMQAMGANQQQAQSTKSVIGMYFKKRVFFLILLALCIIVLTSSALMNCGVNIAQWVLKIINMLNGKMAA